jgi:lipopolysaccharide transport system ATP-binding protein
MRSDVVISVSNLSKAYRLGTTSSRTLREDLSRVWARLRREPDPLSPLSPLPSATRRASDLFWALRDVSFEVKQGEVLGIIGRNGTGKSTLLKILSRITAPTQGEVRIKGRVGSLLEVGTGFHPDLTGRENIFLNGAILGMSKAEITRKFDEIVAFSGLERFIDTPVKRYSSGMYVRLAFAVAAHLDPEILVLDEVLAVGDAEFQKRCLGKMGEVAKGGRTVLFVSHNISAVSTLCTRALLLDGGRKLHEGPADEVIGRYIESGCVMRGEAVWNSASEAPGNDKVRIHAVRVMSDGKTTGDVMINRDFQIVMDYRNLTPGLPIHASFHLLNHTGIEVLATSNLHSANLVRDDWFGKSFPKGNFRSVCTIPGNFLNDGKYSIRAALCSNRSNVEILTEDVIEFVVHETGEMRKEYLGHWIGVVRPKLAWQTEMLLKVQELKPALALVQGSS